MHDLLSATRRDLLTIIVPRHPRRGTEIAAMLGKHGRVARRSKGDKITPDTQFYVADTMGELGLFYRLCEIVFMGGSLVAHGGQNPLEPARLSCGIVTGPHTHNFADIYQEMEAVGACLRVEQPSQLAGQIDALLNNRNQLSSLQSTVRQWLASKGGATTAMLDILAPIFEANPV